MKAVVYRGKNDLKLEDVAEPKIEYPADALIKVTTGAICASDVHIKNEGGQEPGMILGHEYCGVIVNVGSEVRNFKRGDRVAGRPAYFCGYCFYCRHKQPALCENGGIFGGFGNHGVQSEYARIPFADNTLAKIPDGLEDEDVIFTGDILSTGLSGVLRTQVGNGDAAAVFGCGPVGLCAVACAKLFDVGLVIAVDVLDYRLDVARRYGAVTINASKEDAIARVMELTGGRGAGAGIEAAGSDATLTACLKSTRRGGAVSILGTVSRPFLFDLRERFYDIFNLNIGFGDLNHVEELIELIQNGKLDMRPLITHIYPLSEALSGYEVSEKKQDNCIKVLLKN